MPAGGSRPCEEGCTCGKHPKISLEKRFWSKVDKNGPLMPHMETRCWVWTAGTTEGYGRIQVANRSVQTHRLAYQWAHGPIPDSEEVDHRCLNRPCVNGEHLRLATDKQNTENRSGANSNSKSGIRGVYPCGKRWRAEVGHQGVIVRIGSFLTLGEAEAAVVAKRNELHTYNELDRVR